MLLQQKEAIPVLSDSLEGSLYRFIEQIFYQQISHTYTHTHRQAVMSTLTHRPPEAKQLRPQGWETSCGLVTLTPGPPARFW